MEIVVDMAHPRNLIVWPDSSGCAADACYVHPGDTFGDMNDSIKSVFGRCLLVYLFAISSKVGVDVFASTLSLRRAAGVGCWMLDVRG